MLTAILIWAGLGLAIAGLAGLGWCVTLARRLKGGARTDDEIRSAVVKISAVNMGSMFGAMMGLAMMLVGFLIHI